MKKTLITLAVLLLSAFALKAQNAIIYTEYHPDTCFTFESVEDAFTLDINQDGSPDAFFAAYWHSAGGLIVNMHVGSDWRFCHSVGDENKLRKHYIKILILNSKNGIINR